jgi:thiamine pyrophosphokinase
MGALHLGIVLNGKKSQEPLFILESLETLSSSSLYEFKGSHMYAVDGGLNHLPPSFLNTQVWSFVGDLDSLHKNKLPFLNTKTPSSPHIYLDKEKDVSDFGFLLDTLKKMPHALFVEVFAAHGKRKDHEIINIFELLHFFKGFKSKACFFIHPSTILTNVSFTLLKDSSFSNFSLINPNLTPLNIHIENACYEGALTLLRPSHGLSNKKVENKELSIKTDDLLYFIGSD